MKGRGGISARLEHVYLIELAQETPILETPRKKRIISLVDISMMNDPLFLISLSPLPTLIKYFDR